MPRCLQVRPLTDAERASIEQLSRSRTAAVRQVERARIVWRAHQGQHVPAIATELRVTETTVRLWIKRFNATGRAGLVDAPRAGRPATYTLAQVSAVIAAALTKPDALGQPFGSWTLDRLAAYLNEEQGLPIKRSRIGEILLAEGLRWRTQEGWFGERAGRETETGLPAAARDHPVDPEFAQKRGRSSRSTRRRRTAA